MSAELSRPADAGTPIATRARPIGWSSLDRLRAKELNRRIAAGEGELEAWAKIATDQRIGLGKYRGLASIPVAVAASSLGRFWLRINPDEAAEAVAAIRSRASNFARDAWDTVEATARGEFGQGKVRIRGEEEVVEIDAAAAAVRLKAATHALAIVGVSTQAAPVQPVTQATFNGPTNVVFTFADEMKKRANGTAD